MTSITITSFMDQDVTGSTEVSTSGSLSGSYATVASVALTIPSHWGGWECFATATYKAGGDADSFYDIRLVIDGTAQQEQTSLVADIKGTVSYNPGAIAGHRTGITSTGSRTIALQALNADVPSVNLADIFLYARAVRTA